MRFYKYFVLVVFSAILFGGCVSTEKRFERAVGYEEGGDYVNAAKYYVGVLKKQADWEEAREGLRRVGVIAIDNYLDQARELESTGQYEEAIKTLDKLDDLRGDALVVGVQLLPPDDYDSYRERLGEAAITSLILQGEQAEDTGDWQKAIELYDNVLGNYELSVDQDEQVKLSLARVYLKWGAQDIDQGYHRLAFDRAANAIEILGEDHPRTGGAIDLQDRAIAEGTRYVAFLPLWQSEAVRASAPSGMIEELDDILQYEYWAAPPLFVAQGDPVQMRREVRRLRSDERPISRSEASSIGEVLEVDYVLLTQTVLFEVNETRVRERTRKTRTRGRNSQDTTYTEKSYTAVIEAEVEYQIIDTYSRRSVADGSVSADASAKIQRGIYAGDYQDLDLSREERRLFDEERFELDMREIEDELLDELAPRLADKVFEDILKQIR